LEWADRGGCKEVLLLMETRSKLLIFPQTEEFVDDVKMSSIDVKSKVLPDRRPPDFTPDSRR